MTVTENIYEEIFQSKKYAFLYKPLVMRICEEEYKKYSNNKDRVKGVKNTLHAMYGAYLSADSFKKANKLMDNYFVTEEHEEKSNQEILEKILCLHASTKERMWYLQNFYNSFLIK